LYQKPFYANKRFSFLESDCTFELTANQFNQNLTNPGWPAYYSNDLYCRWTITAQPRLVVMLTIEQFITERRYDTLTVSFKVCNKH